MVPRGRTHYARSVPVAIVPNLSRLFAVCVSILLFATFGASIVLLRSPFFHPLPSGYNSHHNSVAAVGKIVPPPML